MFNWVSFITNSSMFFGIFPARILHGLGVRYSILLGGLVVSLCHLLAAKFVHGDIEDILVNDYVLVSLICGIAGQAACLIFLATSQALLSHSTVVASAVIGTVLFTFYLGADSRSEVTSEDGWTFEGYMKLLAVENFIAQVVNGFLIIEPSTETQFLSISEVVRKGVFFKNLGLVNILIALAFTSLVLIDYYFLSFQKELGWAMTCCILAGFAIPYLIYHVFNEQSVTTVFEFHSQQDEEQAELGVDLEPWELKDRWEPWLFALVAFFTIGISRMMCENSFILSLGKTEVGLAMFMIWKASELVGVMVIGLVLIFFRSSISPAGMMIMTSSLMLVAQANMLNPDQQSI